jgi:hypothetical protein
MRQYFYDPLSSARPIFAPTAVLPHLWNTPKTHPSRLCGQTICIRPVTDYQAALGRNS